jgi:hypothetical protein
MGYEFIKNSTVFPSEIQTVMAAVDEEYGGAHNYKIQESTGFANGQTQYSDSFQWLNFVRKTHDGQVLAGVLSEQIVLALIDRHVKLNAVYPSPQNEKMIAGLQMFIDACEERVKERIERGVMGDLKK